MNVADTKSDKDSRDGDKDFKVTDTQTGAAIDSRVVNAEVARLDEEKRREAEVTIRQGTFVAGRQLTDELPGYVTSAALPYQRPQPRMVPTQSEILDTPELWPVMQRGNWKHTDGGGEVPGRNWPGWTASEVLVDFKDWLRDHFDEFARWCDGIREMLEDVKADSLMYADSIEHTQSLVYDEPDQGEREHSRTHYWEQLVQQYHIASRLIKA